MFAKPLYVVTFLLLLLSLYEFATFANYLMDGETGLSIVWFIPVVPTICLAWYLAHLQETVDARNARKSSADR